MSQFSRRARWLQQLFPSSVLPATVDPTNVSDDVSLVQQYDGAAVGIAEPSFPVDSSVLGVPLEITEPEVSIRNFLTTVGIASVTDLFNLPNGLYARIIGISYRRLAGASPGKFFLSLTAPTGSGVSDHQVVLTWQMQGVDTQFDVLPLNFDIVPPGMQVNAHTINGDAATQVELAFVMIVAPIGAIVISTKGSGREN